MRRGPGNGQREGSAGALCQLPRGVFGVSGREPTPHTHTQACALTGARTHARTETHLSQESQLFQGYFILQDLFNQIISMSC